MFLVAFDRRYNISRIKVFSGVGFVDKKITVPLNSERLNHYAACLRTKPVCCGGVPN
jgi:hypothetical protein